MTLVCDCPQTDVIKQLKGLFQINKEPKCAQCISRLMFPVPQNVFTGQRLETNISRLMLTDFSLRQPPGAQTRALFLTGR